MGEKAGSSSAQDYQGERKSGGIVKFALDELAKSGWEPEVNEIFDQAGFKEQCEDNQQWPRPRERLSAPGGLRRVHRRLLSPSSGSGAFPLSCSSATRKRQRPFSTGHSTREN